MSMFVRRRAPTACWHRQSPQMKSRENVKRPLVQTAEKTDSGEALMNNTDFQALVSRHRNYFRTGATRSAEWREAQLIALRAMMTDRAEAFYASLWADLRRNRTDADLTDVKYLVSEAEHARAHLRDWMKPAPVSTPSTLAPAGAHVRFDPLGVGLI